MLSFRLWMVWGCTPSLIHLKQQLTSVEHGTVTLSLAFIIIIHSYIWNETWRLGSSELRSHSHLYSDRAILFVILGGKISTVTRWLTVVPTEHRVAISWLSTPPHPPSLHGGWWREGKVSTSPLCPLCCKLNHIVLQLAACWHPYQFVRLGRFDHQRSHRRWGGQVEPCIRDRKCPESHRALLTSWFLRVWKRISALKFKAILFLQWAIHILLSHPVLLVNSVHSEPAKQTLASVWISSSRELFSGPQKGAWILQTSVTVLQK